jgi:hypothetical protein
MTQLKKNSHLGKVTLHRIKTQMKQPLITKMMRQPLMKPKKKHLTISKTMALMTKIKSSKKNQTQMIKQINKLIMKNSFYRVSIQNGKA